MNLKRFAISIAASTALALSYPLTSSATGFDWLRALSATIKGAQAVNLTDEQMASYVKESVDAMDRQNRVLPESDPHTKRLRRLTAGITQADGIPLNFKVYNTQDVNAFACPDGSVRVYSALMDIMSDDELMGIIGHEIGHVVKRHSRKAFRNSLLSDALRDALAATSDRVAALTDSQLGELGLALSNAKFSRKQEREADDCGYEFLVANGKNPWGMVMAFEKFMELEAEGQGSSSYITKMFSSHPDTKERIERMSKRAKKDGYKRP